MLSRAHIRPLLHLSFGPTLIKRFAAMIGLRRQRAALARLEERLLDDIGVDQDAARAEAQRPVWDVPRHWLR